MVRFFFFYFSSSFSSFYIYQAGQNSFHSSSLVERSQGEGEIFLFFPSGSPTSLLRTSLITLIASFIRVIGTDLL